MGNARSGSSRPPVQNWHIPGVDGVGGVPGVGAGGVIPSGGAMGQKSWVAGCRSS